MLQSIGLQTVGHNLVTEQQFYMMFKKKVDYMAWKEWRSREKMWWDKRQSQQIKIQKRAQLMLEAEVNSETSVGIWVLG